jgi:hypothetical protein
MNAVAALSLLAAGYAVACPYTIRDAGFIVRDPAPYRVYVCVRNDTPRRDELAEAVAAASTRHLMESNVTAEFVNLDEAPDHEAADHLGRLDIAELPAAILVTPGGGSLSLPGLGPELASPEAVETAIEGAVSSPRREELLERLVEHWAVLVLAEGPDAGENERLRGTLARAAKRVAGKKTELGMEIETGPHVLSVSAQDARESVWLRSIGLEDTGPPRARIGVLFGMGRRLGPVLPGEEADEDAVLQYTDTLTRTCTCTSDPSDLLGPCIPLVWDAAKQEEVRETLGFDPDSPGVRMALAGVWPALLGPDAGEADLPGAPGGYVEFWTEPVAEGEEPGAQAIPGPDGVPAEGGGTAAVDLRGRTKFFVLLVVGATVLIAAAGGAWLIVRASKARGG